ncbi:hypothetical protein HPP92_004981, partial [Vanilla planifolia]
VLLDDAPPSWLLCPTASSLNNGTLVRFLFSIDSEVPTSRPVCLPFMLSFSRN